MAIRYRTSSGNWSSAAQWDGGTLPGAADDVYLNNQTVTLDQDVTVLSISNAANTTPAIAAGGSLTVSTIPGGGRAITANIMGQVSTSNLLVVTATSGTLTITGNVTRGATGNGGPAILLSGNGGSAVVINGNVIAGAGGSNSFAISSTGNIGDLTINGNVTGSGATNGVSYSTTVGRSISVTGTVNNGGLTIAGGGVAGNTISVANMSNTSAGITLACVTVAGSVATMTLNTTSSIGAGSTCALATLSYTTGTGTVNISAGAGSLSTTSTVSQVIGSQIAAAASLTINVGGVTGPVLGNANTGTINHSGTGTVTVNCTTAQGGTGAYNNNTCAVANTSTGTLVLNGDVIGAASGGGQPGAVNQGSGTFTINGTATGGVSTAAGAPGAINLSAGVMYITKAKSNDYPNGGNTQIAYGATNNNWNGWLVLDSMEDGSGGVPAYSGRCFVRAGSNGQVKMRESNAGVLKTFGANPTDYPAPANVRDGTAYNSGAQTGTLKVPPVGSVAVGVPVDAAVGTAVLNGITLAQIEASTVLAMKADVAAVPAAVRSNLAAELARIDVAIGTRLATTGYTAPLDSAATQAAAQAALIAFDPATVADLLGAVTALQADNTTTQAAIAALPAPDNAGIAAIKSNTGLIPGLY